MKLGNQDTQGDPLQVGNGCECGASSNRGEQGDAAICQESLEQQTPHRKASWKKEQEGERRVRDRVIPIAPAIPVNINGAVLPQVTELLIIVIRKSLVQ